MGIKRKTRELVIQTLYGLNYAEKTQEINYLDCLSQYPELLKNLTTEFQIENDKNIYIFADNLLKKIILCKEDLDEIINKHAGNVKIEKLGVLELSILRLAVYEMVYEKIASAVIINEAVDLAKKFSAEKSPALINAILDKINITYNEMRKADEV